MTKLSENYGNNHHVLHHPPHFDFDSVDEIPDSHAWPQLNDHPSGDDPVPVVDLSDPDFLNKIADACETWGVFQLTGHGVPMQLLERVEWECLRLFSLPAQQKLKALRRPDGISGYGLARISPFFSKLMWSEGFTIAGSPLDHARNLWPSGYNQFCEVIEEYNREMKELSVKLMRSMLASLGLSEEDVAWSGPNGRFEEAASVLQLNSYPSCPDPDRAMGLASHTDSSLFTVLYQSSTSGLQVLRPKDTRGPARWVTVPPLPGALVVNVGDLFQILSDGRYLSVFHRALVNRTRHRVSVAYIYGPPSHAKISPASKLLTRPGRGSSYRAVTWPEYLELKAKHFDKALAYVKMYDEETQEKQDQM